MDAAREQIELIQPIALLRAGTHEDAVRAVALASVQAFANGSQATTWQAWIAGRFAKTVRRARPAHFDAAAEHALAVVRVGDAAAAAFAPMTYADMPDFLRKMQVAGTDLPRTGEWGEEHPAGPALVVNDGLEMSTGKAAAQTAHALFGWGLKQSPADFADWAIRGFPFTLDSASGTEFVKDLDFAAVTIADAGLTEVVPGSITVAAFN